MFSVKLNRSHDTVGHGCRLVNAKKVFYDTFVIYLYMETSEKTQQPHLIDFHFPLLAVSISRFLLCFGSVPGFMETQIRPSSKVAAVTSARGKQAHITAVQPSDSLWRLLPGSSAGAKEEPDWSACI